MDAYEEMRITSEAQEESCLCLKSGAERTNKGTALLALSCGETIVRFTAPCQDWQRLVDECVYSFTAHRYTDAHANTGCSWPVTLLMIRSGSSVSYTIRHHSLTRLLVSAGSMISSTLNAFAVRTGFISLR